MRRLAFRDFGAGDQIAALAAVWLTASWVVANFYDFYTLRHWWTVPVLLVAVMAAMLLFARHRLGPAVALLAGVLASVAEHLWRTPIIQSDTLPIIRGAFELLRSGRDPYGVLVSNGLPAGTFGGGVVPPPVLYEYPPGPFIVFGPAIALNIAPVEVERFSAILFVLLIAALARLVGPGRAALAAALYGTYAYAAFRGIDNGDDTTLGLLFAGGAVLIWYAERGGSWANRAYWVAVPVFALALLFKQIGWLIYLPIALHLWLDRPRGRTHVLLTGGIAAAVMLPFFVWGPAAFIAGVFLPFTGHKAIYGLNFLGTIAMINPTLAERLSPDNLWNQLIGAAIALAILARWRARSSAVALAHGCGLMFVAMFLARWTSPAYFMSLIPLLALLVAIAPLGKPDAKGAAAG